MQKTPMQKKTDSPEMQRLDQWLYCARFFKTRNAAITAIKSGRVLAEGSQVKPSKSIRPGSLLTIRHFKKNRILTVLELQWKRLAPRDAQMLYHEKITEPVNHMLENKRVPLVDTKRPSKRERRQLASLKRAVNNRDKNSRLD